MLVADAAGLAAVQPLMFRLRGAGCASGTSLVVSLIVICGGTEAHRDIMGHGKISVAFGAKQKSTGLEPSLNLSKMTRSRHSSFAGFNNFKGRLSLGKHVHTPPASDKPIMMNGFVNHFPSV